MADEAITRRELELTLKPVVDKCEEHHKNIPELYRRIGELEGKNEGVNERMDNQDKGIERLAQDQLWAWRLLIGAGLAFIIKIIQDALLARGG